MVRVEGKNGGAFPLTWTVEYDYEQLASLLLLASLGNGSAGFCANGSPCQTDSCRGGQKDGCKTVNVLLYVQKGGFHPMLNND